jgi:hypothetical protein
LALGKKLYFVLAHAFAFASASPANEFLSGRPPAAGLLQQGLSQLPPKEKCCFWKTGLIEIFQQL